MGDQKDLGGWAGGGWVVEVGGWLNDHFWPQCQNSYSLGAKLKRQFQGLPHEKGGGCLRSKLPPGHWTMTSYALNFCIFDLITCKSSGFS